MRSHLISFTKSLAPFQAAYDLLHSTQSQLRQAVQNQTAADKLLLERKQRAEEVQVHFTEFENQSALYTALVASKMRECSVAEDSEASHGDPSQLKQRIGIAENATNEADQESDGFSEALDRLREQCIDQEYSIVIQTLSVMVKRILDNPNESKFRSIRKNNVQFVNRVSRHGVAAERIMLLMGFSLELSQSSNSGMDSFKFHFKASDDNWIKLKSAAIALIGRTSKQDADNESEDNTLANDQTNFQQNCENAASKGLVVRDLLQKVGDASDQQCVNRLRSSLAADAKSAAADVNNDTKHQWQFLQLHRRELELERAVATEASVYSEQVPGIEEALSRFCGLAEDLSNSQKRE